MGTLENHENYGFDARVETQNVIAWIKNWFDNESGRADGVILAVSGGCDSMVAAKLCCEAIGANKICGVLMPNKTQADITDSYRVCEILGISYHEVNIGGAYEKLLESMQAPAKSNKPTLNITQQAAINIAPRLRMAAVYAMGQTLNYRVAGAGNFSELYVGYCTKWGVDTAYDFNPIANFTKTEVRQIGDCLGLPRDLVYKTPADGLSGRSDEENLNITYEILDNFIRTRKYEAKDAEMIGRIERLNKLAQHKSSPVPCYNFGGNVARR